MVSRVVFNSSAAAAVLGTAAAVLGTAAAVLGTAAAVLGTAALKGTAASEGSVAATVVSAIGVSWTSFVCSPLAHPATARNPQ